MAPREIMADQLGGGDGLPTWLVAILSVIGTLAGWSSWRPIGAWVGRRLDAAQREKSVERTDMIARLTTELTAAREETRSRVEENVQLRQELGEERELRMTFAQDYAVLKERIEGMSRVQAEDKRDCQREIRRLNGEIRRLNGEIAELRQRHQGPRPPEGSP